MAMNMAYKWRVNLTTYRLLSSHSWLENGPSQDVFSIENRGFSLPCGHVSFAKLIWDATLQWENVGINKSKHVRSSW